MSKFNKYARELDAAFKEAREKYSALYEAFTRAKDRLDTANSWFQETYTGERAVKQARAKADFQEAEMALRKDGENIWEAFMLRRSQLGYELAQAIKADNIASPDAVDNNALELLKLGVLTGDDMLAMAEKFDTNPTMLKIIAKYAGEAAQNADRADRGIFYAVADGCKNGSGKIMRAWEELASTTNYCSGIGGGERKRDARFAVHMAEKWEELANALIENF